jgi:AmiR/NasT family two-component response regulator
MRSESLPGSRELVERVAAARREVEANLVQLNLTQSRLEATRQLISAGRTEREVLHASAFARLAARLDSQPVIEQAKGILIERVGCTPDEAFGMLRAASQRSNVRVRELARDIVARAASVGRPGPTTRCVPGRLSDGHRGHRAALPSHGA